MRDLKRTGIILLLHDKNMKSFKDPSAPRFYKEAEGKMKTATLACGVPGTSRGEHVGSCHSLVISAFTIQLIHMFVPNTIPTYPNMLIDHPSFNLLSSITRCSKAVAAEVKTRSEATLGWTQAFSIHACTQQPILDKHGWISLERCLAPVFDC
jgi:hypothetical protein